MNEYIKEKTVEEFQQGWLFSDLIEELYSNELNFNNADPSTNMRCYSRDEIESIARKALVQEVLKIAMPRIALCFDCNNVFTCTIERHHPDYCTKCKKTSVDLEQGYCRLIGNVTLLPLNQYTEKHINGQKEA